MSDEHVKSVFDFGKPLKAERPLRSRPSHTGCNHERQQSLQRRHPSQPRLCTSRRYHPPDAHHPPPLPARLPLVTAVGQVTDDG
ncbi:MAG TPA: hypothetical protein PKD55_11705, partial [Bellilinea sp.]|nr:hypothetical protein [Bellilinea sp.]